jgi:TolB-like protein
MTTFLSRIFLLAALALLSGCATIDQSTPPNISGKAPWVILPFANNTETPLAANRAEGIAEGLLRANGIARLTRYPASLRQEALFGADEHKPFEAALAWARQNGARYALTGSVDEWRYKVGVDGEPVVGVALSIIDLANGETLWTGSGGKSGWSREALSAVARQLMRRLIQSGLSARLD